MVVTRENAKAIFDHVVDQILSRSGSGILKASLSREGYDDILSLMTIDDETIENLTYPDPDDASNSLNLRRSDKAMLKLWREYVLHREASDNPIGDNWLQVTQADFDAFRISPSNIARLSTASLMAPVNQGHTSASTAPKFSKVDIFRKGIKRDMSLFPTLKDKRFNDAWHRSFVAQARAQDVDKVLDGSYIPSTQEEKDLFTKQQKYIYAVLEAKVPAHSLPRFRATVEVFSFESCHKNRTVFSKLVIRKKMLIQMA